MEEIARVILTKLKLVDPTISSTIINDSEYQQIAEVRQLWKSVESSIHKILEITSITFSTNPLDASSVLSASTLLSSIIHAIITTQRRINKLDENIENIIKKEMQVILYHIKILNQSHTKAESAQEAIIYHIDILVDSLVTYLLFNNNSQVHPYKVFSPCNSFQQSHSQPEELIRKQSSSDEQVIVMQKTLSQNHQYDSNNSLVSNSGSSSSSRETSPSDTVGKKFMRSIHHSLKSRSEFHMTLSLSGRHSVEPTETEQKPKKKQSFYDHRVISEIEDGNPENSDDDDVFSSNHSGTKKVQKPTTPRFLFATRRQSAGASLSSSPTAMNTKGGGFKDLFQSSPKNNIDSPPLQPPKKKSASLGNLFISHKSNNKRVSKEVENKMLQESIYSFSTDRSIKKKQNTEEINRPFLISPFAKRTDIQWTVDDEEEELAAAEAYNNITSSFELYSMMVVDYSSSLSMEEEEDTYISPTTLVTTTIQRKRHSNESLVTLQQQPSFIPMTPNNSPLPSLPTVENFLTIMNRPPTSPESSYFSARSTSSSSSSQSTLNSILLDDVTNNLEKTQITTKENDELMQPPIPPPKDHSIIMNNKQEKRSNSMVPVIAAAAAESSIEMMRIFTNVVYSSEVPKSADATKNQQKRPPIPPRTSSMPLVVNPSTQKYQVIPPPLPVDAKKKANAYSRRTSTKLIDEWLGRGGKDDKIRAKLGRSLGAAPTTGTVTKKSEKTTPPLSLENAKLLKVTENGHVVLLFEMMNGKLQAIAGTTEKLFEKLADETAQDLDYIDTYLMNHAYFINSLDLLNLLINRFHLEPSPGEYEYFIKWQFSIQTKILNVVERWISHYYYQDFKYNTALLKRVNLFLYNDSLLFALQFKQQLEKIRFCLKSQVTKKPHHHLLLQSSSTNTIQNQQTTNNFNFFHFPFVNSTQQPPTPVYYSHRRPSNVLFHLTSPPDSPTMTNNNNFELGASLESKDIARYLTLADYYLFKSIQAHGLFSKKTRQEFNYIELMTKRANMLSHWVVHEICSITDVKPKRALLKKFIEIAKLCLELNNFHTCMVITMGLASAPKLEEIWESLSNRDMNTFTSLQKLLDVSLNMRHYRQKIQLAKSPCIPFLPVVLKDQTFFKENSTFSVSHPNLINFSKFRSIRQFVEKIDALTREPYCFANDLTQFPFFPDITTITAVSNGGTLDIIGDWVENRLNKVQDCYLYCDLLK